MLFSKVLAVSSLLGVTVAYDAAEVFRKAERPKKAIVERATSGGFTHPKLQKRADQYLTDKTAKFAVNGTGIPDVPFDVGESYAGLLPISSSPDETRELFFWYFPSTNPAADKEIVIWFNGGPGCSSLGGFLSENGPFLWQDGTIAPTQNPYSWTNLTNMMWVEQPVGVGYSQGVPNITDEVELAQEFLGFYKSFVDTFDAHGWDVYLTGESYAGYYVPYIADAFIKANDLDYYNLKGISINDPIFGDETNQQQTVIPQYAAYWQNMLYLNDSFIQAFTAKAKECGYIDYMEKYFTFPPPGPLPLLPDPYNSDNYSCDVFDDAYSAILTVNPCFNIYHISDACPFPSAVLGAVNTGDYVAPHTVVYFNRSDVQEALHAVVGTNWQHCTRKNVFGLGTNNRSLSDRSVGPALNGVLQNVIEYTNNTIIGSGDLDMLLPTNGTLLALQNVTWNGLQGLQEYPGIPFYTPDHPEYNDGALAGSGYLGSYGVERGLTFYRVQLAGHELPGYAPGAAYRTVELLLGRIKSLSDTGPFTTQTGNFTGTTPILRRSEL
ncbi:Alpha/Beta hydrolase protein [Elsinoe ampelina]|uniref:Carboxypeptidase n=1 Tax=Elsinoe ampelina TaxID=302913 RepID=A0A6A6GHJ8_9PEZI|nr:Alpha/Beta hydrolase protein [Elsinoe ampelina]